MIVNFTKEGNNDVLEKDITALDVITDRYRISIRNSGISVFDKQSDNEAIINQNLDLTK